MPAMQFAIKTGDTAWKPPGLPISQPNKQSPETVTWDQVQSKVGFAPLAPTLSGVTREQVAIVPASQAYHGSFGSGVLTGYSYQNGNQKLLVTQRKVLQTGQAPLTFLYRATFATARSISLKGSPAVLVLPTPGGAGSPMNEPMMPFLEWGPGEFWVTVNFLWSASETLMLDIANSLS